MASGESLVGAASSRICRLLENAEQGLELFFSVDRVTRVLQAVLVWAALWSYFVCLLKEAAN